MRTKTGGMGRLYDKGRESGREDLAHVVRFEGQERRRTLGGLALGALTDNVVDLFGRQRFKWCGFDLPVSTMRGLVLSAMDLEDLGEGMRLQLVGYATLLEHGFAGRLEKNRDYRLRKLLERVGLPAPVTFKLDIDAGLTLSDAA